MKRGDVWWADLPDPLASKPGFRRPVVVIQSNEFNRSRINTIVAATITSNLKLANAPGNVSISARSVGLNKPAVINVSQIVTLNKSLLTEQAGRLSQQKMAEVDAGIHLVLAL